MTTKDEQEYIQGLEDENRFFADLLNRMSARNLYLTEQRNRYWKELQQLKRDNDELSKGR